MNRINLILEAMAQLVDKRPESERLADLEKNMRDTIGFSDDSETMSRVAKHGKKGSTAKRLAQQILALRKANEGTSYIESVVKNYLMENIFSSSVKKDQGRGVEKATGHAVELDMSKPNTNAKVKMAQDSKVVKGLITKGFTHAESSEGGNKVKLYFAGPRQRNTWLKKWRSLDIPKKTNESYDAGQPKPVRIRELTGQRITQVMKNMTPAQKQRLMKKIGPNVRKLTKGGAFVVDRIMQQESYKYGGYMSRIQKGKRRLKRMKNIKAKRIEGERRRNKTRTETQREN